MHWLIIASLTWSLASSAPPDLDFVSQHGQNHLLNDTFTPVEKETSILADLSTDDKNESSEEIVSEKNTSIQNGPESHVSTIKASRSEESSETVGETPTKREDAETTSQEQSPNQNSVEQQEVASEIPSVSGEAAESTTKIPTTSLTTRKPKPSKPKPPRATTLKPLAVESPVTPATHVTVKPTKPTTTRPTTITAKPTKPTSTQRYPCRCGDGICSCCTGILLENFNVPLRSRACANVSYEPDDFAFNFKLAYNNIVLYNRRMSAKNPRPVCIPINRYFGVKMCAKLSNVYMSGRNMHACLDFEGFFSDETAFNYSFNCFRVGSQGVAIVRPEDGGGLPPPPDEEEQTDEDYDDSARQYSSDSDSDYENEDYTIEMSMSLPP